MDDRFEFVKLIGKGSTGGVYKAICKQSNQAFTIRRFFSDDGKYRTGWEHEFLSIMRQLASVNHPNVVPVIEASLDHDGAYLITEYHPTSKLIDAFPRGMNVETFLTFAEHSLSAFNALHSAGVVHGRLGYDSFLLSYLPEDNYKFILKDYGLRRIAPLIQGLNPAHELPTNPIFIAPELFSTGIVEERTDLYMLGQLFYVLLTGCHPISGKDVDTAAIMHFKHNYKTVAQQEPQLPSYLSEWVDTLTQPEIDRRPTSCSEALMLLKSLQTISDNPLLTNTIHPPRKLSF